MLLILISNKKAFHKKKPPEKPGGLPFINTINYFALSKFSDAFFQFTTFQNAFK